MYYRIKSEYKIPVIQFQLVGITRYRLIQTSVNPSEYRVIITYTKRMHALENDRPLLN